MTSESKSKFCGDLSEARIVVKSKFCGDLSEARIVVKSKTRVFTIYCLFHLVDHIYNMNLFCQIESILRENKRKIHYYCPKQYHKQVAEFSPSPDVLELRAMHDLDGNAIYDKGLSPGWFSPLYELHIGNKKLPINIFNRTHNYFDKFYEEFYAQFLETWFSPKIAKEYPVSFISKKDPNLLVLYENLPQKFKDLDILFINSKLYEDCRIIEKKSQQNFTPGYKWNKYIINASRSGLKIATIAPIAPLNSSSARSLNIPCTMNDNLTIKTIAAISTRAKNIIAINAGSLCSCFNEITMEYVDKIYVFDIGNTFLHKKIGNTFLHEKVISCENIDDIILASHTVLRSPKPIRKISMDF